MIGGTGKSINGPSPEIDVFQFRRCDQYRRGSFAAAIGLREKPDFPAASNAAQPRFRGVVRKARSAIIAARWSSQRWGEQSKIVPGGAPPPNERCRS